MSIYLADSPSLTELTGSRRRLSTPMVLVRAGLIVIAVHALLLASVHWMLLRQFADRSMPDLHRPLASAFARYSADSFAIELLSLIAAVVAVAGLHLIAGRARQRLPQRPGGVAPGLPQRPGGVTSGPTVAAAGLLAYVPVASYSLGVLLALSFGWEPDVFIMSSAGATNPQISATIQEALPIVLQPLAMWRQLATIVGALVFAVLQRRLCGISTGRAIVTAVAAGLAALVVQFTML